MHHTKISSMVVLENDHIHEYCPLDDYIKDFIDTHDSIKFTIWDRFNTDAYIPTNYVLETFQHNAQSHGRIAYLAYPSFIGYDNALDGWIQFMDRLTKLEIKIDLYLIHGYGEEQLISKLLHHIYNNVMIKARPAYIEKVVKILEFHNIHVVTTDELSNGNFYFETFQHFSAEYFKSLCFQRGEMVRIKETGEIKEIVSLCYFPRLSSCDVDLIMSPELHESNKITSNYATASPGVYHNDAYKMFHLLEIEKV